MQLCVLFLVLIVNACCSVVSCLYLHMGDTETKCFLKEIAEDIKVIGKYTAEWYDGQLPAPHSPGMFVEVKDPAEKVILSGQYGSEGIFSFISHTSGQHHICLWSNSSSLALSSEATLRVHLDIQVQQKMSLNDKLKDLQLRLQMLTEQMIRIQQENNYQKYREERFRQTSEGIINRVWYSILFTLVGVVALTFWKNREFKSLNLTEAEESETFVKPDIFINVKPKE